MPAGRRFFRLELLLIAAMVAFAAPSTQASADGSPALFNSGEVRSENLAPFPKWTGVLERYFEEKKLGDGDCMASDFNRCHLNEWQAFLDGLGGLDPGSQLDAVNRYMNEAVYITDLRNYGVKDVWATPSQFFTLDGDCEDYAIAKFMSLRALGFGNDKMRIVVLQDLNLKIGHAVLAVYLGGEALILDNQVEPVVPSTEIHHYFPLFSLNEDGWWLHKP